MYDPVNPKNNGVRGMRAPTNDAACGVTDSVVVCTGWTRNAILTGLIKTPKDKLDESDADKNETHVFDLKTGVLLHLYVSVNISRQENGQPDHSFTPFTPGHRVDKWQT